MKPITQRGILIVGDTSSCLSFAKALANQTETNVSVSPFAPEPLQFKITSENLFNEPKSIQRQFYENQLSKFIGKPKNNFRKR
jgi:hypothetical protein